MGLIIEVPELIDTPGTALFKLSDHCGIHREFLNSGNEPTVIQPMARADILRSMGFTATEEAAQSALQNIGREEWLLRLPETIVLRSHEPLEFDCNVPAADLHKEFYLSIEQEDGSVQQYPFFPAEYREITVEEVDGSARSRRALYLPHKTADGYHRLELLDGNGNGLASCALLVAPQTCHQPPAIVSGGQVFGLAVQLYTVRSQRNWGMGDFTDLARLCRAAADTGADILGVNPLHALFPANPLHFSPYSPSNRSFLNVLYLDVEAIAEFRDSAPAQQMVADRDFQRRLTELRECHQVDYAAVAECKFAVTELLFQSFCEQHLDQDSTHALDYHRFVNNHGEVLRLHASYDAMHELFMQRDSTLWGWPVWPNEYRHPDSPEVALFARDHALRVEYFQYLQWCAELQLRNAQQVALAAGMGVGLYLDLAIGVDQGGSEVWSNQKSFCLQASAGAPPDAIATGGQDWGFPPLCPRALKTEAYSLFRQILCANMSIAGAVRLDHAVGLARLWWISPSSDAANGAYVDYPMKDLLGVIALESRRNKCLVIGEDLGTVPLQFTQTMQKNHLYSYRVLYFEQADNITSMPRETVVAVTTHDLPTLASWWNVTDITLRTELNLLEDTQVINQLRLDRATQKQQLLERIIHSGCWKGEPRAAAIPSMTGALNEAIHGYLALSSAAIMMCQIEDLLLMLTPVNVPGTFMEYRNWQRKLKYPLEDLFERSEVKRLLSRLSNIRRK